MPKIGLFFFGDIIKFSKARISTEIRISKSDPSEIPDYSLPYGSELLTIRVPTIPD
jgi:hypothetical protein